MGRWFHSFVAQHYDDENNTWEIGITETKFRRLQKNGDIVKLVRLALVEEVVSGPIRIVRGWERPDTEQCLVYVGKPDRDFHGPRIEKPPPPNMLFVVFVLPDGTIDYWNWRPTAADDPFMPEGIGGVTLWQG
jgi:hypothetical protein